MAEVSIVFTDNSTILGDGSEEHPLAASGGGVVPGGADTDVQFNDAGSFGGDSRFTFNKTTGAFTLSAGNNVNISSIAGSINFTSPAGSAVNLANAGVGNLVSLSNGRVGFFGSLGTTQPTITGSRDANDALASVLTALAAMGLIIDSST